MTALAHRLLAILPILACAVANAQDNLALHATKASASSWRPEYPPPDSIDGNMQTSFSVALGAKHDQWFQLDWASPQTIGGFAFWQPDRYTESFDVEVNENGSWVKVAHAGTPGPRLGKNVFVTFEAHYASAMRLVNIESTEVGGCAFYEIAVYSDPKVVMRMKNAVDVALAGDAAGGLIGTVSAEAGSQGIEGARVEITGRNPIGTWSRETVTKEHGFFYTDLPLNPIGPIKVVTTKGEQVGGASVNASDISHCLTPRPTQGRLSLEGQWDFLSDPGKGGVWKPIRVPSNYEMEGYTTKTDRAAYRKTVTIPASWVGKRIKLRAEAIYSYAEVSLNGKRIGSHEGGATPFELDLTDAAKPGQANELRIDIKARSRSAEFDHMSVYAYFEIAGIWRPIEMFCVEPSHVSRLTYAVHFDKDYRDARLGVDVNLVNEQKKSVAGALRLRAFDPAGKEVELAGLSMKTTLGDWDSKTIHLETTVKRPKQWNAEQPRNYKIVAEWTAAGQKIAKVEQPLGFRQVEVKGRAFSINGKPVRLFGTCLHASDPLRGRALTVDRVKQDLELIKEANLNAIRTSHYPPHPMTPVVADQLGIYIEDEGPSCWADGNEDLRNAPMYIGIVSEYVERDRNHPSVVYWSTCNESNYGIVFQLAHRYAKMLDPTRPVGGTYAPENMDNDIYVLHHPTNIYDHIEQTKNLPKPVFYDECLTVPHGWNDLAHSLEIDPGMHDFWEWRVLGIRRQIMKYENQVGTMSWAWVDDAFLIPGRGSGNTRREMPQILYAYPYYQLPGRGYQGDTVWGMVDSWRRPRPEWWEAKKVYSPIIIEEKPLSLPSAGSPIRVPVENMNWFTNLSAYKCKWTLGGKTGTAKADVAPSSKGFLSIGAVARCDDTLTLKWYDETGRLVDAYNLRFKEHSKPMWAFGGSAETTVENDRYLSGVRAVYLKANGTELAFDQMSGVLMWGLKDNEQVLLHGPSLHILKSEDPTADDPKFWQFTGETHKPGEIQWNGSFGDQFVGGYTVRMGAKGQVEIDYNFTYKGPDMWVREIGLEFEAPSSFDRLSWDKNSEHSYYPLDHIGRPVGTATAHSPVLQTVPPGDRPFGLDDHAWGSNDFRSTKRNIWTASLTNVRGQGLRVVSDGTQHVRAAVGVHGNTIKVLDFYGGSGGPHNWSVEGFHYGPGHLLKTGEVVSGKVRLELLGAKS